MAQQNPLEEILLQVLKEKGFDKLSQADQDMYLSQFTAEADRRLSIALIPLLSEEGMEEHVEMLKNNASPEQWTEFWNKNIEDFPAVVSKVLENFSAEIGAAFNM